ncbi:hypothetical protein JZO73_15165 [Enterococcus plantarum]|uniref:hypothetical protein n=1 Tax=Enterococcus plantarum TaxID=1077675 RepID=UPI001A8D19E2|nr:hypothetical protein [Enterococcus plantarum]MBO0468842.1 hypothetical protein [Enterococcus plantarum]
MEKQSIKTKNNQPIKMVSHQEVYSLHDLLEQLNSWKSTLKLLNEFFSDQKRPVNKKKIANEYHACSQIFTTFHNDFSQTLQKMESQIIILRGKEKI